MKTISIFERISKLPVMHRRQRWGAEGDAQFFLIIFPVLNCLTMLQLLS